MTDEEFQALRERYRRAGDAWRNQLDTARRAELQADKLLAEFQDLEQRLTAEQSRRYREAEREQNTAEIRRQMQGVTGLDEEVAQMRGRD